VIENSPELGNEAEYRSGASNGDDAEFRDAPREEIVREMMGQLEVGELDQLDLRQRADRRGTSLERVAEIMEERDQAIRSLDDTER
jgi:hypothetical protein